jgi:cyclic pyranopterin phosphate synthase
MDVLDRHARPLRSLRLSVTDRCNLRCAYCMPEEQYRWLPRADLLSFEELAALTDAFCAAGVERVRLTGGEPLLRRDLPALVRLLAANARVRDLALTTNGLLLAEQALALREAGLRRLTISLDTLRPERFLALTRRDELARVLAGIEAARAAGFAELKLDTVVLRDTNEDELAPLLEYAAAIGAELRFIEYMDVGGATHWAPAQVVSRAQILAQLERRFGPARALPGRGSAPAERYELPDGRVFGLIASTTEPFCGACDRSRVTADGQWLLCLYAKLGIDLRAPLRAGATRAELAQRIRAGWSGRSDRGALERLALAQRAPLVDVRSLQHDPHLEMHTRGG